MFDDVTVDLVLERSKERPPVVDECDNFGGGVITTGRSLDQPAYDFEQRFMRKQVFVQISSLYFILSIFVYIAGIIGKLLDVFKLSDRVVFDWTLKHSKVR